MEAVYHKWCVGQEQQAAMRRNSATPASWGLPRMTSGRAQFEAEHNLPYLPTSPVNLLSRGGRRRSQGVSVVMMCNRTSGDTTLI